MGLPRKRKAQSGTLPEFYCVDAQRLNIGSFGRLRNNATIQTVSALLLHLVQTVSADLEQQVKKALAGPAGAMIEKDEAEDIDMKIDLSEEIVDESGKLVRSTYLLHLYDVATHDELLP